MVPKAKKEAEEQEEPKPKIVKPTFQTARGVRDVLPKDQKYWQYARSVAQEISRIFGFRRIDVPTFESVSLFDRGIGTETDIISKEIFLVSDKNSMEKSEDKKIDLENMSALRPEFTAGIIRAYIQNGMYTLPQPLKLYTIGPVFRHEKPQRGRYREHYQLDFEILGDPSPKADAWVILAFWESKKLKYRLIV